MSKLYREQGAVGGSKLLASVALGQSQAAVLATAKFENDILDIADLFQSKQQREEAKIKMQPQGVNNNPNPSQKKKEEDKTVDKKKVGRQEKPDDQKSEKTIKNREAMS